MEIAEVGLGFVTAYNPVNATIDIRTIDGTPYPSLAFDSNLALYSTPVLPIMRTEQSTGSIRIIKLGSCVLFAKFSDSNIRIIRIFNDDQDIVKNIAGRTNQIAHNVVRDTLLSMLQDGEVLVSAPGRIIETSPQVFERQAGSWLLLKNSGDAILSNADSSCEVWVSYTGQFEVNATKYRLRGVDTRVQEEDSGALVLASGENRGSPVSLTLSKNATAQLTSGASYMTMTPTGYDISSGVVNISGGNELNLNSANLSLSASVLAIDSGSADIAIEGDLSVAADMINIDSNKDVTITVGDNVISVSKENGISIAAASGQQVVITNGEDTYPVVYSTNKVTDTVQDVSELRVSRNIWVGV